MSDLARELAGEPTFTPYTIRPDIMNRREIAQAMEESYPPLLRDAGVGGTVNIWFFIDEEGVNRRTLVNESSGHPALDDAALRVAEVIKFTPAYDQDGPVPVWISLPITFTASARRENAPARPATPMGEGGGDSRPVLNPTIPEGAEPTPFTVRPDIMNRAEVARAMEAEYPPLLRDAGIGGRTEVWFYIDAEGVTQRLMVGSSSGHEELDQAALRVASAIEFTAALDGDEPVPVWIVLPITFTTR
jgi:TonB family protein